MDFRQRQTVRKILYSRATIAFLVVVLIVLVKNTWEVYEKERETRSTVRSVEGEYQNLGERKTFLETEIERLGSPAGIEEEVRERFGVVKEGERVLIIVDEPEGEISDADANTSRFWTRVRAFFIRE